MGSRSRLALQHGGGRGVRHIQSNYGGEVLRTLPAHLKLAGLKNMFGL